MLDAPRLGCVNIHASLLPRWRGAAPIQRAIAAGDATSGVCFMQMDAGLDTGPVLSRVQMPIADDTTGGQLHDALAAAGGTHIVRVLEALDAGALTPEPQTDADASYARKLQKAEALIDWTQPAEVIDRRVRAFNPWPVCHSPLAGATVRVFDTRPLALPTPAPPGTIVTADPNGIGVATGRGVLGIQRLQWPGGKRLTAAEAINGRDLIGRRFGA